MKDALGHGSNAHSSGVAQIGLPKVIWGKSVKANVEAARQIAQAHGLDVQTYRNPKSSYVAAYHRYESGKSGISLNISKPFWRDPVGVMSRATNLSSNSPEHVIHHEIGHVLYDPPDNFMTLSHQDLAREHVSKYAATNPKEFVSEVHAGMKVGKTFPEHVMTAFRQYARPRK